MAGEDAQSIGDITTVSALLALLNSNSGGTNLNTLQDLFSPQSMGLPLSVSLGTMPFDALQQAVEDSMLRPLAADQLANIDYEATQAAYSSDPVAQLAFESVMAGVDPEQWAAQQKAALYDDSSLSSDARTARGFEIDGIKAVAKVFQQQYNAAQDLSRRQALGEIKSVDGQLYEVVSDADRRKALSDLGITGVLADPEMYRDTAREEALKAVNDWMSKESKSSQMSRDYTGRQVEAMRETAGDRKDLAAAFRMANEMRSGSRQYAGESRSNFEFDPERPYVARTVDAVSAPNAPKVAPSMKRTVLDDTTIRAMAGISAADKKERNFVQGTRSEQAAIARQREADQAERDRRLDVARNTRGTTAAEKYLDNQRALLAAVATPTEKQSASTAVARPKVRLSSDQIASIVGAITR